ncbi:PepSY domain-containing protein [Polaribacter sp. Z014]|uniref:PepSY domain-containing protein n=1 Tax=Polaribacter sp. Z014 TaxID=2927126 RepID=UPI002021F14B|nr:PepSY domain-containing protein [Polaribacter sp. Z014]MCL7764605.1 PepSY domain-containing protein [Polaribacter sp. Z014]
MAKRKNPVSLQVRIIHRYLGYFLAGIMFVYALSGIIMIFRDTDFLKTEVITEKKLAPNLTARDLAPIFKKGAKVIKQEGAVLYLRNGNYNQTTGLANIKKMQLPFVLDKMEKLHKANTNSPLYFLNIFFGVALLFFVFSAFWMYTPKMPVFKKGMYFAAGGIVLTIILLFV